MADEQKNLQELIGTNAWKEDVDRFIASMQALDEERAKAAQAASEMQTYSDRYRALLAEYEAKIALLESQGYRLYAEQARAARNRALNELSETAIRESDFWDRISAGTGAYSRKQLRGIVDEIDRVLAYINGKKGVRLPLDVTPEQLDNLKAGSKVIQELRQKASEFQKSFKDKNPFQAFGKTVKEGFSKGTKSGFGALFSAGGELIQKISGPAKAVIGVVKGVMGVVKIGIKAEKRHQAALEAVRRATEDQLMQYELLSMQKGLKFDEGRNIFGVDEIGRATNALKIYRQAMADYKQELQGEKPQAGSGFLGEWTSQTARYKQQMADYEAGILRLKNIQIVTGHEKTGIFGWGKGKDVYSGILSVYPDLIDSENRLNIERAEAILSTRQMSDENKKLLQNLIDLTKQGDAALEELRSALQETYGDLGQGILDALVGSFEAGTDAAEAFGQKVGDVLEKLGTQVVYTLFFQKEFDRLQKDLEEIYAQEGLSEEAIINQAFDRVDRFYNEVSTQLPRAQEWMRHWQEKAADSGYDLWAAEEKSETVSAAEGMRGEISEKITEQTASRLEGLFRLGVDLQTQLASLGSEQLAVAQSSLVEVADIARTNIAIEENTRRTADNTDGLRERLDTVAAELKEIKKNTAGQEVWAK